MTAPGIQKRVATPIQEFDRVGSLLTSAPPITHPFPGFFANSGKESAQDEQANKDYDRLKIWSHHTPVTTHQR
jgi:hypothetical protein